MAVPSSLSAQRLPLVLSQVWFMEATVFPLCIKLWAHVIREHQLPLTMYPPKPGPLFSNHPVARALLLFLRQLDRWGN